MDGTEDALLITKKGMIIRFSLTQIRDIGRATSGVKLMNIEDDDRIISVAIFKNTDHETETDGNSPVATTIKS